MNKFRPRLPETPSWEALIEHAREYGAKEVLNIFLKYYKGTDDTKIEESNKGRDYVITSDSKRIKTLDQLLDTCKVDLNQYAVERKVINKWDQTQKGVDGQPVIVEQFQVKAFLKKLYIDTPDEDFFKKWLDNKFLPYIVPVEVDKVEYGNDVVVSLADLHIGGVVQEKGFPKYDVQEAKDRLAYIAHVVNTKFPNRNVHLKFLGDFIESFTGKNHKDTWEQIEIHGAKVALLTADILKEFILMVNNVHSVDVVGGNHDRVTAANDDDTSSQVAELLTGMLERMIGNIPFRYDRRILTSVHDDICYLITHGDKRITKMEPAKMVLEYGDQNLFNLMLNAHGHSELIHDSSIRYQARQIPPVTVPNRYALDIGKSSPSGFVITEKSPRSGVEVYTYSL